MSNETIVIEPSGSNGSAMGKWSELLQKVDPHFLNNNKELITSVLGLILSPEESDENKINLEEYGFESADELQEVVGLIPRYNQLVEDFEELLEDYNTLQSENDGIAGEINALSEKNKQFTLSIKKAKRLIDNLKAVNQQLKLNNRILSLKLKESQPRM